MAAKRDWAKIEGRPVGGAGRPCAFNAHAGRGFRHVPMLPQTTSGGIMDRQLAAPATIMQVSRRGEIFNISPYKFL